MSSSVFRGNVAKHRAVMQLCTSYQGSGPIYVTCTAERRQLSQQCLLGKRECKWTSLAVQQVGLHTSTADAAVDKFNPACHRARHLPHKKKCKFIHFFFFKKLIRVSHLETDRRKKKRFCLESSSVLLFSKKALQVMLYKATQELPGRVHMDSGQFNLPLIDCKSDHSRERKSQSSQEMFSNV